jgi:hypothetical protein
MALNGHGTSHDGQPAGLDELEQLAATHEQENGPTDGPPDPIAELNKDHFVARHAGRTVVVRREHDPVLGRAAHVFIGAADLKLYYANRRVPVGTDASERPVMKPLADAWFSSPARRTFERMVLQPGQEVAPDVYNLWRGWGIEPKPGNWTTIRRHLLETVCAADDELFEYFRGWMAFAVQHPDRRPEVAVVLRGGKGAGKGAAVAPLMRIFGGHAIQLANAKHLTGNFNAHLLDALLVFADESFWAGDKQGESVLKGLITEPVVMIERKGVDPCPAPNRLKLIMASNAEWVVPATADERRFFVLDVSPVRTGDREYFKILWSAIEGEETAAMLHDLLHHDLDGFEIRDVPQTKALAEQKLIGGDSVSRWWFGVLQRGAIDPAGTAWPETVGREACREFYRRWCIDMGDRHPAGEVQFAKLLARLFPEGRLESTRPRVNGAPSGRHYTLMSLERHREAFAWTMKIGQNVLEWDEI